MYVPIDLNFNLFNANLLYCIVFRELSLKLIINKYQYEIENR